MTIRRVVYRIALYTTVVGAVFFPTGASSTSVGATGLVAAYSFNESSGSTVLDPSGNGNNGTISNAYRTSDARYGSALSFNGKSSMVTVPDSSSLDLTNTMTLEAWVKPGNTLGTAWKTIVLKEQTGELVYGLYANSKQRVPAGIAYSGGERTSWGTSQLPIGVWTHVATTYDGSAVRLYVNGNLVSTTSATGSMPVSGGALRIGGNSIWNEWFYGKIDEVRVYNRALASSEIQGDMQTPIDSPAPAPAPAPAPSPVPPSTSGNLVGDTTVETNADSNTAGSAEAFRTTAVATGQAGQVQVYIDSANTASTVEVGVYVDNGGQPGTLLAQGTVMSPSAAAWNAAALAQPASITAGQTYWIAILGSGGTVRFRDGHGTGPSQMNTSTGLSSLPASWSPGASYSDGPLSAYLIGAPTGSSTPPPSVPPASDTTPPSTPPALAVAPASSSIGLSWGASSDDVGVTGYNLFLNGSKVGTTAATSYTFSGLACGTVYTLGVDAYDAAGNQSGKATLSPGTSACPAPPPGGSGSASLYLSPVGSDANPCTQAAPCRTFDRAYHAASLGTIVLLASGDYGGQALSYNAGFVSASSPVVFQPAPGATAQLSGELSLRASSASQPIANVEFDNLTVGDIYVRYVRNVTFRNVTNTFFFVRSSDNVSFIGGSSGGDHYGNSDTIGSMGSGTPASTNVLIDGVRFHDFNNDLSPGTHDECVFIQESSGVTIRNSTFANCRDFDIYGNVLFGGSINAVTLEGNHFGVTAPVGYYAFRANVGTYVFRNNAWDQGMANDAPVSTSGCGNTLSGSGWAFPSMLLQACP